MKGRGRLTNQVPALRDDPIDGVFDLQDQALALLEVAFHDLVAALALLEQVLAFDDHAHGARDVEVLGLLNRLFDAGYEVLDGFFHLIDAGLRVFDDLLDLGLDVLEVLFDLVAGLVKRLDGGLADAFPLLDALGDDAGDVGAQLRDGALDVARKRPRRVQGALARADDLVDLAAHLGPDCAELAPV